MGICVNVNCGLGVAIVVVVLMMKLQEEQTLCKHSTPSQSLNASYDMKHAMT